MFTVPVNDSLVFIDNIFVLSDTLGIDLVLHNENLKGFGECLIDVEGEETNADEEETTAREEKQEVVQFRRKTQELIIMI